MAYQYTKGLPVDPSGQLLQDFPAPKTALARYTKENGTTSSVISASHDTTSLEVTAIGAGAVLRWVTTSDTQGSVVSAVSGANYDHVIAPSATRRFAIPIETTGASPASVQGANRANGLYQRYAIKSFGAASVMVSEF